MPRSAAAITLTARHDARAQPPADLLTAMAVSRGPGRRGSPRVRPGELITRLRVRVGTRDLVGIATTLLPGVAPT